MRNEIKKTADEISRHPRTRMEIFRGLSLSEQEAAFEVLSPHIQQSILKKLQNDEIVDLLDQMDFQRAKGVLARLKDRRRRERIIRRIRSELKKKVEYFLRFHPKAAINLLNFNYLFLSHATSIKEAARAIHKHYKETGKFPEVLAHQKGRLVGEVLPSALVLSDNSDPLKKHIKALKTINYRAEIQEIVELFKASRHGKIAVLDEDESVLGIIYSDDALKLFGEIPADSLYEFAGVSRGEQPLDTVWSKVRRRYRWLIINLATAFLAASVVGFFRNTIDEFVLLAVYMPIIAGMGGNAAAQTLAVTVRGITLGETTLKRGVSAIRREVGAGLINGIINGALVAVIAIAWNKNATLGIVVGVAMVINLVIAGFFGAMVPLIMQKLGKDPATSAIILITTATDVFGFFAFLGLASILLL